MHADSPEPGFSIVGRSAEVRKDLDALPVSCTGDCPRDKVVYTLTIFTASF